MNWLRRLRRDTAAAKPAVTAQTLVVDIAPDDPLVPFLVAVGRPVDIAELELDSPAVQSMREAGIALLVPLVSHGELISVLQLGKRLSDQPYSSDDLSLLTSVADGAAPALRVAQLLDEKAREARERERFEAELRVAQLIQQHFLPRELPARLGWTVEAYYEPAREVGGDFYDFFELDHGRLGVVVGDVTDKGVPAALVMTSTRTLLRASAQRVVEPAAVLRRVNSQLNNDIPDGMFVTCLYGILDPQTGSFRFANAGHNLPIHLASERLTEPKATGLPLGLLPDADYDEAEVTLDEGDALLLYSDALPEAHSPDGEMYGFDRVRSAVAGVGPGPIVDQLLAEVGRFTGPEWEQEDDVTVVVLHRGDLATELTLEIPSAPGNERQAIDCVVDFAGTQLTTERLERLKTAVGEATMNAIEHGNRSDESVPVELTMAHLNGTVVVTVADQGEGPPATSKPPNLEAKLRGDEPARGWGLLLIEEMVDEFESETRDGRHVVVLKMKADEVTDA